MQYVVVVDIPELRDDSIENVCSILNGILVNPIMDEDALVQSWGVMYPIITVRPLSEVIAS